MKSRKAVCLICAFMMLLTAVSCDIRDIEHPTVSETEAPTQTEQTVPSDSESSTESYVESSTASGETEVPDASENATSNSDAEASDTTSDVITEKETVGETHSETEANSNTESSSECTHAELEWTVTKSPTCKETGSRDSICLSCGITVATESISTVAHTEEVIVGTPATCTSAGLGDGKKCSVCGDILVEQQATPMLSHTEKIVKGTQPTCTKSGTTDSKICSECSTVLVPPASLEALDHNESDWMIDLLPTNEAEGSKHTECTRCQTVIKTEKIPVISVDHVHEGKEWLLSVPPSCTEEGRRDHVCECGTVVDTQPVACVPHTEVTLMAVASTCTSTGLTEGKQCSVCKNVLVAQAPTAKSGHTEETVAGKAPTCTEYGFSDGKKCTVCSATLETQIPIAPAGHVFEDGVCTGCGKTEAYGIWIVDGLGNPLSNIIIKVFKDGNQIKMYQYKGEYLSLDIERGNYTIELDLSMLGRSYDYDESLLVLTPDKKNTTIRLFESLSEPSSSFVGYPLEKEYNVYSIGVGSYFVELTPNDYTFFIFSPETAAIYTITYEAASDLKISYHGSSFFIQGADISEDTDTINVYENGLSFSVYSGNVGGDMVFGVWSDNAESCILNIRNAGDPGTRLEDEPWVPYLENEAMVNKQLSASKEGTYTAIDLTDMSVSAVFNDVDGYYHLGSADGPIIFIDLTSDSRFISSIQTICANQRIGAYIYDENGNVAEKRSYTELFIQYGMPSDSTPVEEPIRIPLTQKLAEAIQKFGDRSGWWGDNPDINIFNKVLLGSSYNQEYAWLLYCGYYQ